MFCCSDCSNIKLVEKVFNLHSLVYTLALEIPDAAVALFAKLVKNNLFEFQSLSRNRTQDIFERCWGIGNWELGILPLSPSPLLGENGREYLICLSLSRFFAIFTRNDYDGALDVSCQLLGGNVLVQDELLGFREVALLPGCLRLEFMNVKQNMTPQLN